MYKTKTAYDYDFRKRLCVFVLGKPPNCAISAICVYAVLTNVRQMSLNSQSPNYLKEPASYSVRAKINPKVFTGIKDYLTAANSDCLRNVEAQFNIEAAKISPILRKFEDYSLNRIDYCINLDLEELGLPCSTEQLMKLIRRGNIPNRFEELAEYDEKSHRMKAVNKEAFYLQSNSVTINCYRKQEQLIENFSSCPDLKQSEPLIRFEIQCEYPKVYSISRIIKDKLRWNMSIDELTDDILSGASNPVKEMLSDTVAADVIRKYFNKVIGKGDYVTLTCAKWMVEAYNFRRDKKERLIWALELINESRGIAKAKSKLAGDDLKDFKRSIRDLNALLINPVTIPREWGIEHIQNPLRAYYDSITYEQIIPGNERIFKELLTEYIS